MIDCRTVAPKPPAGKPASLGTAMPGTSRLSTLPLVSNALKSAKPESFLQVTEGTRVDNDALLPIPAGREAQALGKSKPKKGGKKKSAAKKGRRKKR